MVGAAPCSASHSRAHVTMRRCRSVRAYGAMMLVEWSRARVRFSGRAARSARAELLPLPEATALWWLSWRHVDHHDDAPRPGRAGPAIRQAAQAAGLSVNAYIVRAARRAATLDAGHQRAALGLGRDLAGEGDMSLSLSLAGLNLTGIRPVFTGRGAGAQGYAPRDDPSGLIGLVGMASPPARECELGTSPDTAKVPGARAWHRASVFLRACQGAVPA